MDSNSIERNIDTHWRKAKHISPWHSPWRNRNAALPPQCPYYTMAN